MAVAEKLAARRTERYFQERAARTDAADFLAILGRAGTDVVVGDQQGYQALSQRDPVDVSWPAREAVDQQGYQALSQRDHQLLPDQRLQRMRHCGPGGPAPSSLSTINSA